MVQHINNHVINTSNQPKPINFIIPILTSQRKTQLSTSECSPKLYDVNYPPLFILHPPVDKQISSQPFCANDFEYNLIGLQSFKVDAAGQSRVKTLSQSLSNDQPPRQ